MKLTASRRAMLLAAYAEPDGAVMLWNGGGEDRVAKGLANLGYGWFTDNRFQYSWRKRSGYGNRFQLNEDGKTLAAIIIRGRSKVEL